MLLLLCTETDPHVIITNPRRNAQTFDDRERRVGHEQVQYPCTASGNPTPTVTWYHNGVRIESGNGIIVSANGTLTIPAPQIRHSGVYQCFAANRLDEDKRTWFLEVREEGKKT